MKKFLSRLCAVGLFSSIVLLASDSALAASISDTLEFKGRLLLTEDTPAANTTYTARFSLWDHADFQPGTEKDAAGNLAGNSWLEVQNFTTDSAGYFSLQIGNSTALPVLNPNLHQYIMAEVKPSGGSDSEYFLLDPFPANDTLDRKPMPTSMFAMQAENAMALDGKKAENTANNIPVLDANGKLLQSIVPEDAWYDPVADMTELAAITSPVVGGRVFVIADTKLYTYNGTVWVADNAALETSLTALQAAVTQNATDITTNADAIADNVLSISNNADDIVANAGAISSLGNIVSGHTTNIAANQTAIDTNNTAITNLNAAVTDNTADITDNSTNIAGNAAAITSLKTQVDTNKNDIAVNKTDISGLKTDLINNTAAVGDRNYSDNNYVTDGESLTVSINSLDVKVKENADAIANLATNMVWKDSVVGFADLASNYPTAAVGWTAYVQNDSKIYTFDGTSWVVTGGGSVPNATTSLAGIVVLAADGETTVGKAVQANDSRLAQVAVNTNNIGVLNNTVIDITNDIAGNTTSIANNAADIITNANNITGNINAIANINANMGNQTYTKQNYVTNGESITKSIDVLDQAVKDNDKKASAIKGFDIYVIQ